MLNNSEKIIPPCLTLLDTKKRVRMPVIPPDMTFLCIYISYNSFSILGTHFELITIQLIFHTKPYQKLWMHQVAINN